MTPKRGLWFVTKFHFINNNSYYDIIVSKIILNY